MNTFRKLRFYAIAFIAFAAMLTASKDASAQAYASKVVRYTDTAFTGTFQSIIGQVGTSQINFSGGFYSYPQNGNYITVAIPFDLNYDSVKYTQGSLWEVHQSGGLSPAKITNYDYGQSISNNNQANFPNLINAWGMTYYPYTSNSYQYSQVTGPIGSRIWTVEYANDATYSSQTPINVQIKYYETTNVIEFWYSQNSYQVGFSNGFGGYNGYEGDIGINGGSNGDYSGFITSGSTFRSKALFTPPTMYRMSPQQVPSIQLSVQPKTVTFGTVPVGNSVDQIVTITNTGSFGNLIVSSMVITGNSDFSIVAGNPVPPLSPGQSANVTVRLTPQTFGSRSAILTVTSNGQDSGTQSIALVGTGIAANIAADSLIRFRKTRTHLGDTLTQYVHLTSSGQIPLVFSSFLITGIDSSQYFISYYPAPILLPGTVDSIGISYVPTLEGKHVALLTINSNAFNFPALKISLQGTGTLPHIVVTPSLLLFDSTREGDTNTCKTITIWNPGTDTLRIMKNFLSSNDGDFHYFGLSGADTSIAPDHTKIVTVCFVPLQQGTRQARLLLRTNIVNTFETPRRDTAGIVTIDIRGTGVPFGVFANSISGPAVLDSALIGTQVCRMDTLKNNGDADIMVTGFTFAGSQFSQNGLPQTPFLLKARTSKVFNLCATPDVRGLLTGTLTFAGRTSGSNIGTVLLLGVFGQKACVTAMPNPFFSNVTLPNNGSDSTLCINVVNCGDIATTYTPTINGAAKADYTFKPAVSGMIKKGDTAIFCIDYKPTAVSGVPAATASFDVASSDKSSVSVPLLGTDGCAVLTHDVPQIPNTGDNEKKTFTFTISNTTGTFNWNPGTPVITGADAGAYKVISITPTPITPTTPATVTMEFHPTLGSAGKSFVANVSWPNGGPCGNALSVDLNGLSIVSSVKDANAEGFILNQSYPNPTQGKANFTYTTPKETEVRITLVDLTGKLVRTLITGRVSQGEHTVNFDASNLTSGTYMYILESGSIRLIRQIILTK